MLNFSEMGKWLTIAGLGLVVLGVILWALGKLPFIGNLPGDIRIEQGNFGCVVPLGTLLLLSLLATIILNVLIRLLRK